MLTCSAINIFAQPRSSLMSFYQGIIALQSRSPDPLPAASPLRLGSPYHCDVKSSERPSYQLDFPEYTSTNPGNARGRNPGTTAHTLNVNVHHHNPSPPSKNLVFNLATPPYYPANSDLASFVPPLLLATTGTLAFLNCIRMIYARRFYITGYTWHNNILYCGFF